MSDDIFATADVEVRCDGCGHTHRLEDDDAPELDVATFADICIMFEVDPYLTKAILVEPTTRGARSVVHHRCDGCGRRSEAIRDRVLNVDEYLLLRDVLELPDTMDVVRIFIERCGS